MNLGPIGVGNSGTYFFCVPDIESTHFLRNAGEKINKGRAEGENLEIVSMVRYPFVLRSGKPLIVCRIPLVVYDVLIAIGPPRMFVKSVYSIAGCGGLLQ